MCSLGTTFKMYSANILAKINDFKFLLIVDMNKCDFFCEIVSIFQLIFWFKNMLNHFKTDNTIKFPRLIPVSIH